MTIFSLKQVKYSIWILQTKLFKVMQVTIVTKRSRFVYFLTNITLKTNLL